MGMFLLLIFQVLEHQNVCGSITTILSPCATFRDRQTQPQAGALRIQGGNKGIAIQALWLPLRPQTWNQNSISMAMHPKRNQITKG